MNYYTKNRKLKLEEYDDNQNLIDSIELNINAILPFLCNCTNHRVIDNRIIERKEDREYFDKDTEPIAREMLKRILMDKYSYRTDYIADYYLNKENIKLIESIIDKYGIDAIKFALDFSDEMNWEFKYYLPFKTCQEKMNETFIERLDWIKNSNGMWYATDGKGNIGMGYFEEPTKKQASYQRRKNNMFIVFISFDDFKEYKVNEDTLR